MKIETALAILVAKVDALFLPDRKPTWMSRHQVICERRNDYPAAGLPWAATMLFPGGGPEDQKQAQRILDELIQAGFVEAVQAHGYKRTGIRLTDLGDQHARAVCDLAGVDAGESSVQELIRLSDDGADYLGHRWIPEVFLTGRETWGWEGASKELVIIEELMAPALCRGWTIGRCDRDGRAWYSVIEKKPKAHVAPKLPKPISGCRKTYVATLRAEEAAFASAESQTRDIGDIALPTTLLGYCRKAVA